VHPETTRDRPRIPLLAAPKSALVAALVAAAGLGLTAAPAGATAVLPTHPDDPLFADQWGLVAVGAPQAWALGADGHGVVIAVVDTGVDATHPDLIGKVLPGDNLVDPGTPPADANGHGTAIAGIAAATADNGVGIAGVAPDASILPVEVLDRSGDGDVATVAAGIDWAVARGAQVVNLSFSDVMPGPVPTVIQESIDAAWSHGVVCVLAAGNQPGSPAPAEADALVVTATGPGNVAAPYASAVGAEPLGLAAPGGLDNGRPADEIASTYWSGTNPSGYAFLSGTSMAAAFASGAVADLISAGYSPTQAARRLVATADAVGHRAELGAGVLNLPDALAGPAMTTAMPQPPKGAAPALSPPTAIPAATTTTTPTGAAPGRSGPGAAVTSAPASPPAQGETRTPPAGRKGGARRALPGSINATVPATASPVTPRAGLTAVSVQAPSTAPSASRPLVVGALALASGAAGAGVARRWRARRHRRA
jgi:subtilisin family serine protease